MKIIFFENNKKIIRKYRTVLTIYSDQKPSIFQSIR